jgi:hypothetical protein
MGVDEGSAWPFRVLWFHHSGSGHNGINDEIVSSSCLGKDGAKQIDFPSLEDGLRWLMEDEQF